MNSLNKVMLIGQMASQPSLRATRSGTSVTNFAVETKEIWNDDTVHTDRHDITAFGKVARSCVENGTVGRMVYVEGKMQNKSIGVNSINTYRTNIIAHSAKFFDSEKNHTEDTDSHMLTSHPMRSASGKKASGLLHRAIPPFL